LFQIVLVTAFAQSVRPVFLCVHIYCAKQFRLCRIGIYGVGQKMKWESNSGGLPAGQPVETLLYTTRQ
jgi:hypothetical protein